MGKESGNSWRMNKISVDWLMNTLFLAFSSKILAHQTRGSGYLLIDGMVELCDTLMSPVFTQLWKDLS